MNFLGSKIYSSGAVGLKVANFSAIMGKYEIWDRMSQFVDDKNNW